MRFQPAARQPLASFACSSSPLLLGCLVLASCGGIELRLQPTGEQVSESYESVQQAWTRHDQIYGDFESIATGHATYISPSFLQALLAEYQRVFNPLPDGMAAFEKEWNDRLANHECAFLALHTVKREWNDLAGATSIWKLYLANDQGSRVAAHVVSPVKQKDMVFQHFFPQMDVFFDGYLVCFPKHDGTKAGSPSLAAASTRFLEFEARSTVARLVFRWELVPGRR